VKEKKKIKKKRKLSKIKLKKKIEGEIRHPNNQINKQIYNTKDKTNN
jgi:hypothetical protein